MEFCEGGELAGILKKSAFLGENVAKQYISEVLSALEYLHFHGIIYRDLKTENVLISKNHVKLTDFDLSKQVQTVRDIKQCVPVMKGKKMLFPTNFSESSTSFVGTAEYLSPEIIAGAHSQLTDFWSLGVLIYELLYGQTPFFTPNSGFQAISRRIQAGIYSFPQFPAVSDDAKDLIKKLLVVKPENRLGYQCGISEIKAHKWFKGVNFARIYDAENEIKIDFPLQQFKKFPREFEVTARDFAGTGFQVSEQVQELSAGVIAAYEKAGMVGRPKVTNFDEEVGVDTGNQSGVGTVVGGGDKGQKRVGLRDLFKKEVVEGSRMSVSKAKAEGEDEE